MVHRDQFVVRLEVFEGPLDLLLTLIRRESLDITTVALARVTDQYLAYLSRLREIDAGALASFCEVAATLIVIKSRVLLPVIADPIAQSEEDSDAAELVERLRAYRQLHSAAEELGRRERDGVRAYSRVAAPPPEIPPRLLAGDVTVTDLVAALEAAIAEIEVEPEKPGVAGLQPHPVRLADRVADLGALLAARRRITFREALTGGRADREFVIVSFLAVLELLRRLVARASQDETFGEIVLELRSRTDAAAATRDLVPLADG